MIAVFVVEFKISEGLYTDFTYWQSLWKPVTENSIHPAMLSQMLMGKGLGFWNTMPTSLRRSFTRFSFGIIISPVCKMFVK